MSGKQMEGDNERRRALARSARERGRRPSAEGVTLGASKQFEHVERGRRAGPPAMAGADRGAALSASRMTPRHPERPFPRWNPERIGLSVDQPGQIRYRDLVADVADRLRLDFEQARRVVEATVTALAQVVDGGDRRRLLDAVPSSLTDEAQTEAQTEAATEAGATDGGPTDGRPTDSAHPPRTVPDFVDRVARRADRPAEQARHEAQATMGALVERDRELIDSLNLPVEIGELATPLLPGGGVVDQAGQTAPLTDDEVRAALTGLRQWTGNRRVLCRTITLPPENLEQVLRRLDGLRAELGRGPHIGREAPDTATVVLWTNSVDAVTALDVALARRVDAAIEEAGAGIA
jgi:pterin-4a-carbinolamine dehydratase